MLVYVAGRGSEIALREELEAAEAALGEGLHIVVCGREGDAKPATWSSIEGRLDGATLAQAVPDLDRRHAYLSGPPGLVAELAPALSSARSLTTDAFAGY